MVTTEEDLGPLDQNHSPCQNQAALHPATSPSVFFVSFYSLSGYKKVLFWRAELARWFWNAPLLLADTSESMSRRQLKLNPVETELMFLFWPVLTRPSALTTSLCRWLGRQRTPDFISHRLSPSCPPPADSSSEAAGASTPSSPVSSSRCLSSSTWLLQLLWNWLPVSAPITE